MPISANPEGLAGDGAELAGEQTAPAPRARVPPGGDPVSASVAAQLAAHGASIEALIQHSGLLRVDGGVATQRTAVDFVDTDTQNASMIAGAGLTDAVSTPMRGCAPSVPALPQVPAMTAPPLLPGEALSKAMHEGGPGPESLREFASHWRSRAAQLEDLADRTDRTGLAIDADWQDDGVQQAGANTRNHGDWLHEMAGNARQLATAADDYADHFQRALDETPTPQEFAETRRAWQRAWADNVRAHGMLSAQVGALAAQYADRQGQATEAGHTYFAAAATTGGDMPKPPRPAPPIVNPLDPTDARPSPGSPTNRSSRPDDETAQQLVPHRGGSGSDDPTPGTGAPANPEGSTGGPIGPAPDPALPAGVPAASPVEAGAAGQAANIAGTIVGAGIGTLSQLAHGVVPSSPAAGMASAPLSALAGLSGLPSMGSPSAPGGAMPEMPSDPGLGLPESDPGVGSDESFDGTSPAVGGGGGGAGGGVPMSPVGNPSPASAVGPVVGQPSMPSAAPAATAPVSGMGGMGMYPPMMAGQGTQNPDRNKDLFPDKRVVLRPVPNTEPVFGELEKQRRPRAKRAAQEEGNSSARQD